MSTKYSVNGFDWKLEKEIDGWISIYLWNTDNGKWVPKIQASNLSKAKDYCFGFEKVDIPLKKLID